MRDQRRMSVLVTGYPGLSGLIRMRNICIQQWSQGSYQFTVSYYEKVCRIYQTWSLNIKICISLVFLENFCNRSKAQSKRRTLRQTSNFGSSHEEFDVWPRPKSCINTAAMLRVARISQRFLLGHLRPAFFEIETKKFFQNLSNVIRQLLAIFMVEPSLSTIVMER